MSAGRSRKYQIFQITGSHFGETAKEAGLGPAIVRNVLTEVMRDASGAPDRALSMMPAGFADGIHKSIVAAMTA